MNCNSIFNSLYLSRRLEKYTIDEIPHIDEKLSIINSWKLGIENKSIYTFSEKELQGTFISNFFDKILGYSNMPFNNEFYLLAEQSTKLDGSKPDATLGYFTSIERDVRAVIELKDANYNLDLKQRRSNDNRTPVEQAFSYAPKYGSKCKWVIVSNFIEIRLYLASNQLTYETFDIRNLTDKKEFIKFYYLLNKENLINKNADSLVEKFYVSNIEEEQNITKRFYSEFKDTRLKLIKNILKENNAIDPLIAIEKAQKILDRLIFICFCRDSSEELLPHDILNRIFKPSLPSLNSLWTDLKLLFNAIDTGNSRADIHKFNGGLFKADPLLDNLTISDSSLKGLESIIGFNYSSELNVNILGHIFEQGISDIEYLKNHYRNTNSSLNLRKKDGIYYTPEHITRYMIHQSIGKWLEDKKIELGFYSLPRLSDEEKSKAFKLISKKYKYRKIETENDILVKKYREIQKFWENYREALSNIKVIDISCGSGAFLNQAFSFLYTEAKRVNWEINTLYFGQEKYFNIGNDTYLELDKNILQNNLFGIDINKESIEISKLSLWLSTANKKKCLAPLDDNIICRDSIVYDISNSDESNFNLNQKFIDVMAKGGFDIVIGNPPYIDSEEMTRAIPQVREFCRKHYKSAKGNWDMFIPFIERGLSIINTNGILSYIVPNKLLGSSYSESIRNMLSKYTILQIRDYSEIKVFEDADVYPIVFSVKNSPNKSSVNIELFDKDNEKWLGNTISKKVFYRDIYWDRYFVKNSKIINIIEKMLRFPTLGTIASVKEAATVSEAYNIKNLIYDSDAAAGLSPNYKKLINTGTIDPYSSLWGIKPMKYLKGSYKNPVIYNSDLRSFSKLRYSEACSEKIIVAGMSKRLECYYDTGEYLAGKSTSIVLDSKLDLTYIIGLLNSRLLSFFYKYFFRSTALNGGYFNIGPNQLKEIPIAFEKSVADNIAKEVIKLTDSKPQSNLTKLSENKTDNFVYALYELDLDEVYIVENEI